MFVPSVSVVIPVYNRAATIQAAIASVFEQEGVNIIEVVVVDDASTDATVERVGEIDDARLRLLRHVANAGAGAARNTGIRAALGDWVAFQDSDDLWRAGKLASQVGLASNPAVVAVYCGMDIRGGFGIGGRYHPSRAINIRQGNIQRQLLQGNLVSTQTLLARRSILLEIGGFDVSLPALEDWDLAIRLAGRGEFALVDEPLVEQRFSVNSLTRDREKTIQAHIAILRKYSGLFSEDAGLAAQHHYKIAGAARSLGKLSVASDHLREARRLCPRKPRYWFATAYLALRTWKAQ